ncbi:hypothetical protein BDQ94DRAFT_176038 [Aspergillus welwitschiae]|uniref:Uncharacterized protein n=1 Tax=Aspergillus welwitschiae TaxID=1341132 RepID=A0A3F3PKR8_9EURO|nr:hypothetical protein BDQ94DRAFT_176038 [Aspergillus welwitschiae]RDH26936.1 hypothetical protein BDQ94DRAFT_176038 [Aspergillus welwitschiae]
MQRSHSLRHECNLIILRSCPAPIIAYYQDRQAGVPLHSSNDQPCAAVVADHSHSIPDSFQRETKSFQVTGLRNLTGSAVKVSQSLASSEKAIEAPDGEHFMETIIGYLRSHPDDPSTKKRVVDRDGKAACDTIQGLLQRQ